MIFLWQLKIDLEPQETSQVIAISAAYRFFAYFVLLQHFSE